ncbi:MAG: F0F1 ATP synthase subunit delta [Candidatus Omnitrophica bacterium]|nr:F0F1 ATP synthase subunit delta [Candidatus Omnitrophota bacterium]MDE2221903.1 F0F1 ATP synthase subunit delta [Candidatus Omnitrophota bacterium]
MGWNLIIQFLILTVVVSGGVIFALYMVLIRTVDGAKQRLDRDAEAARQREAELNQKIKEADAELQKRNKELDIMEKKMRQELEERITKQKEEIIGKARSEAEEIINKAQNTRDQIRREIEKTMEIRIIDYAAKITSEILGPKVREGLDKELIKEFIDSLGKLDMSRINADITAAEVVSATPIPETLLADIAKVFKTKLSRDIKLNPKVDPSVVGGVMMMFESLQLDGSLQNGIKEAANALKQQVEKQYSA